MSSGEFILEYNSIGKPTATKIIDYLDEHLLSVEEKQSYDFYEGRQDDYEKYLHLTFKTFNENELDVRKKMISNLNLDKNSNILEIAAGTGRDSLIIAEGLNEQASFPKLYVSDISAGMLSLAEKKLNAFDFCEFLRCSAVDLPFKDNTMDAIYSFGGVGEFGDISKFFKEAVRVVKPGGVIVVGDENLPVWQRNTTFGEILINYNKQFLADVPFDSLPVEARKVKCEWIIGGVFYLLTFEVGEGELYSNFDFEIPGVRGGTHKTRFYGKLEGVSLETKRLAWEAVQKENENMHDWLDKIVKKAAMKSLNND